MTKLKRVLAVLLTLATLLSMVPVTALAAEAEETPTELADTEEETLPEEVPIEEESPAQEESSEEEQIQPAAAEDEIAPAADVVNSGSCGDNLTWTLDEDGTLTISGTGAIYEEAFESNHDLKKVIIQDGVTAIGDSAFHYCSNLASVTIGNSVTTIGDSAFIFCDSLASVTIPDSVTAIGDSAFANCGSLTSVTIGNSVAAIGDRAFEMCTSLTSVTIPDSVTTIGDWVFSNCNALPSVTIPDSVTTIGNRAFRYCDSLTSIVVGSGNAAYSSRDGVLFDKAMTTLISYPGGKEGAYAIPDGVTAIGDEAFDSCTSLTGVTIPDSVTDIGCGAFSNCSGLPSVTIPASVTTIGGSAFSSCDSLTSVAIGSSATIPDSVTTIGDAAFMHCTSLTGVIIGSSVTAIGNAAFNGCSSLPSVTIPASVTAIGDDAFQYCSGLTSIVVDGDNTAYSSRDGVLFDKAMTTLISCPGGKEGAYAIPDSVTTIGDWAFSYCYSLSSVTIPDSATIIGSNAFCGCDSLTSATIPASVTAIGSDAFEDCPNLTIYGYTGTYTETYANENGIPFTALSDTVVDSGTCGENVTWTLDADGTLTISGTGAIDRDAFFEDERLNFKKVIIQDGVTAIGDAAFYGCTSLTSVTIPDSVTTIGYGAFSHCSGLTSVAIPDSVTTIGFEAFYGCASLPSVTIPASVSTIGEEAFYGCSGLTSVTIPNGVTTIGDWTFGNCSGLTSVTIPNSVTTIGDCAFRSCSGLTSVTIPASVTTLGAAAFSDCSGLTSVTIPNSVTTIGEGAFSECTSLKMVTFRAKTTVISSNAFQECPSDLVFYCYPGSTADVFAQQNGFKVKYLSDNLATPAITKVENGNGGIRVTWNKVPGAEKYRLYVHGSNGWKKVIDTTSTSATFKGISGVSLKSGTTYTFTVRCVSADGKQGTSDYNKTGKTIRYLSTPKLVSAANTTKGVTVTWKAVPGAQKYRVYYKKSTDTAWQGNKEATGTSCIFGGGASGKTYIYTVRAVSGSTLSYYEKPGVSVVRLSIPAVTLKNGSGGIAISWDQVGGAKGYYVWRKTGSGDYSKIATIKSGSTVSYTDTGVKSENGATYTYAVRAYNGSTLSAYTAKTLVRLTAPTISGVTNSAKGTMTVKWNKNSKATGYQVYYKTGSTTKIVTVKGNTNLSKAISGLSKGKTYTVYVRSYKTVSGVNYYSSWSSAKNVKISK